MKSVVILMLIGINFALAWNPANDVSQNTFVLENYRNRKIEPEAENLSGEDLVDYVNQRQNLWTAELNERFESYSEEVKRGLMGVRKSHTKAKKMDKLTSKDFDTFDKTNLPKNFDSRENWPMCQSIKAVRDQSSCGSCWAFGAVEAMSDRICIASKGKLQVTLSADDLLSCCDECGFGCNGGQPNTAWQYWVDTGIVTGSNKTLNAGCRPYPFDACEHHTNATHFKPCQHELYPTPKCEKKCQKGYKKSYKADKYYGKNVYNIEANVQTIQRELMLNGPVEATMTVFEDFESYQKGIYAHHAGKVLGGHAVKLIGWGEENGIPYWTLTNSWNPDWGENGFFRILRGVDECGIESGLVAGIPLLK